MRNFKRAKGWVFIAVGLSLFGCATTEDVRILDEDTRRLQLQLNAIQKEGDFLKKELVALQKKNQEDMKKTQEDLSGLQTETQRLKADLIHQLENLRSEMRTLSIGIEEYKEFLKKPSKEIERLKGDAESRLKGLEEKWKGLEERQKIAEERLRETGDRLKGLEGKTAELTSRMAELAFRFAETEKAAPIKEPPVETKGGLTGMGDRYRDAYETFQKGNLEAARKKFEAFLKQYPNTELSDNAQFWIGETYYLRKDFEKAILEYEKAIAKYPEGDKIPAALFKQALAFLELGDKTNGRNLLKRVIERYPHSDQAEMARKRLETIK